MLPATVQVAAGAINSNFQLPVNVPRGCFSKLQSRRSDVFSENYWRMRQRFFQSFFFNGLVCEDWSFANGTPLVTFADQIIAAGYCLVFLSAESKLVRDRGLDEGASNEGIAIVLQAFDLLSSDACDDLGYGHESGFFVRDWVVPANRGRWGIPSGVAFESDAISTNSANDPSQDQVLHLMVGLWAVSRWCSDANMRSKAKEIVLRTYKWLERHRFTLRKPDGGKVRRGDNAAAMSGILQHIASYVTGSAFEDVIIIDNDSLDEGADKLIDELPVELRPLGTFFKNVYEIELDAISILTGHGKDRPSRSQPDLRVGFFHKCTSQLITDRAPAMNALQSFARHLTLMGAAFEPHCATTSLVTLAKQNNHWLSALVRRLTLDDREAAGRDVTHRHAEDMAWREDRGFQRMCIETWRSLPFNGPNARAGNEWAKSYRWNLATDLTPKDEARNARCTYNGLDFLCFEGLMRLVGIL